MVTWDNNFERQPEDTDSASYGAYEIRTLKTAIRERLELEHNFQANTQPFHKPGRTSIVFVGNSAEIANLSGVVEGCLAWDTEQYAFKVYHGNTWLRARPDDPPPIIPSGTKMVFAQSSAPTGWTLDANHNDRLLRVVNSNGGNVGGTWNLQPYFSLTANGNHTHTWYTTIGGFVTDPSANGAWMNPVGNHTHTINYSNEWRPAYIDTIICTKD